MIYLALLPNPFMHPVAVSDAAAAGEAVAVAPPAVTADPICGEMLSKPQMPAGDGWSSLPSGESDPAVMLDYPPAELDAARNDVLQTVGPTVSGRAELTYAETIAQLEALLQGYRDFDDAGRDITDATLVYADPPPIYLRQARA